MSSVCTAAGGDWRYDPAFLPRPEADALFEALLALPDWAHDTVRLFGKEHLTPRLVAWYGDSGTDYRYSGTVHHPLPWPQCLSELRERLARDENLSFDSVLANHYRDGRDSMGWHSDDERELGTCPVIASVSVGATRRFLLRHRTRRDIETVELELAHGSLLVMRGTTQRHWKHSLPKSARCKRARVNLTFRQVLRGREAQP
jgi:alkylated DNA repair dioxygenase AlkB